MADKTFDKMNKAELVEAAELLKLVEEVAASAKDPEKITNAEYIAVLEAYKATQDEANADIAKEAKQPKTSKTGTTPVNTPEQVKATMAEDYGTLIPVIVTDHDSSVTIEDDSQARTVAVRWGNPVIGMSTTHIPLHGKMQYVPKGAVIRLRKIPLANHTKDADGREMSHRDNKRFSVADTTGWTEEEFNAHRDEQRLKKI